jgi:hypothetical protein
MLQHHFDQIRPINRNAALKFSRKFVKRRCTSTFDTVTLRDRYPVEIGRV